MNRLISLLTAAMVAALSCVSFALSYSALRDLALASGAVAPSLAWAWPLVVDGAMIVFSLTILRASLYAEHTVLQWALVAAFSALSVALNVIHAPSNAVAWVVAGVSPIALLLSFESLMSQIRTSARRRGVSQSLSAMTEAVVRARQELAELERRADDAQAAGAVSPVSPAPCDRAAFLVAYSANGHRTVAELAHELGVNVRTAQRWVKSSEGVR